MAKPDRYWTPIGYDDAAGEHHDSWPGPTGLSEFLLEDRRKNRHAYENTDGPVTIMGIQVTALYFKRGVVWTTWHGFLDEVIE